MRTRARGNVIDAKTEPLGGAILDPTTFPVWGGLPIPDGYGLNLPAFMVLGDQARLFPVGRTFVIDPPSANAGTFTVIAPGGTYFKEHPPAALPYHINNTTEIPVSPAPPSAGSTGIIPAFGIDMGGNNISDLEDPTDPQDCATKNYIDNIIVGAILPILNSLVLPGSMVAWSSDIIPTGWYLCDGSAKTVAGDNDLWVNIGYQYGGGGLTFNVPDLRGRFAIGINPIPIVAAARIDRVQVTTLGGVSGSEEVTVLTTAMAAHSHTGTALGAGLHSHSGSTSGAGQHSHLLEAKYKNVDISLQQGPLPLDMLNTGYSLKSGLMSTEPNHSHPITNMSTKPDHTHPLYINGQGGGAAHENVPPYQTVNYIIKR